MKKGIKIKDKVIPYWAFWLFLLIVLLPFEKGVFSNKLVIENSADTSEESIEEAFVSRVIDGDTIELSDGRRLRYIGIDTPEMFFGGDLKDPECFAKEALEKNKDLVLGKKVVLKKDISEKDKYGRVLRYVYVGDSFINLELVKQGYAISYSIFPDLSFKDDFKNSENNAKDNGFGIWSACKN